MLYNKNMDEEANRLTKKQKSRFEKLYRFNTVPNYLKHLENLIIPCFPKLACQVRTAERGARTQGSVVKSLSKQLQMLYLSIS